MNMRFRLAVTSSVASAAVPTAIKMWDPLNPVQSFFEDLAKTLRDWYLNFLETMITVITSVSLPSPKVLQEEFFSLALGGTYGFTRIFVALVATVIAIIVVLSPTARHGLKIQRALTSLLMVILFGWLFYPLYVMLYHISKAATMGSLALLSVDDTDGAVDAVMALFPVVSATDAINTIVSMGISGTLGVFVVAEAVGLFVLTLFVMIGYPIAIAVRPLGAFGSNLFNAANAALVTTLVAPPVMSFAYLLPAFAQKYLPGIAIVASPFFAIVGSVAAILAPVVIFFFAFKRSHQIFGRIDDASGKFDIDRMPPVSVQEVQNDVRVTNQSTTAVVAADVLGDTMLYGKDMPGLLDDAIRMGVNVGATAATAAGHPYIGMAVKAAGGAYNKLQEAKSESSDNTSKGGD